MKVLITGSSGFLGSTICEILSKSEHQIHGIDIKEPQNKIASVNYHNSDLKEFIKKKNSLIDSFDLVIHTASILPYKSNEKELRTTNVESTMKLVDSISKSDKTFFIYVSSSGIYGRPKEIPITKETSFNPLDIYAETKLEAEAYLNKKLDTKRFAIIRPRTILGESRGGIFNIFFKLIKLRIPLPIPNYGKQKLQFVDVEDVASLLIFLGINTISGVWPAAAPDPLPLKDHLKNLEIILDKKIFTFNINPSFFQFVGNLLINLKISNFTKWHFGAFPFDNYFSEEWKQKDFKYKYTSNDTFIKCAKSYFDI